MTEQLPPDVIARLRALDPAITPELAQASWALLAPFHEKLGYTAPRIVRDLRYGEHPRHRLDVHAAGEPSGDLAGVRGAVLISGIYTTRPAEPGAPPHPYYGVPSHTQASLPCLAESRIPLLFAVAERDPDRFQAAAAEVVATWAARHGTMPDLVWVDGHNHMSAVPSLGVDEPALGVPLARFVERHTATP